MSAQSPTLVAGTIRGIAYDELAESMAFEYNEDGPSGTRVFLVAWANRHRFVEAMVGYTKWRNDEQKVTVTPQTFPDFPALLALSASIAGHGAATSTAGEIAFSLAKATIRYGIPAKGAAESSTETGGGTEDEKVLATEELDFSAEVMMCPEGSYKWLYKHTYSTASGLWETAGDSADKGKPVAQQVGILMPSVDHVFTKSNQLVLPNAALRKCIGKVNNADFNGISAGYLLFAGARARRTVTAKGKQPYEIVLTFKERCAPWNCIWNTTDKTWAAIDPSPYQGANFGALTAYVA